MRSSLAVLLAAVLLAGCRTTYRARSADLADLAAVQARDGAVPATSFDDDEAEPLSIRARAILAVGPDDGTGQRRIRARDGRTLLGIGLAVAGAGLAGGALVAASHPEDRPFGELQYLLPLEVVLTGGVVAGVGAILGSPEAD